MGRGLVLWVTLVNLSASEVEGQSSFRRNAALFWELVRDSVYGWQDDYAASMGAALSYYMLFSLAPLLVIVTAVSGLLFGQEAVSGKIFHELSGIIGSEGAATIQDLVTKSITSLGKGLVTTLVGILTVVVGATAVFNELQNDLDRILKVSPRQGNGLWDLLHARFFSFGMVLGIGFLLIASLVVSAALSSLSELWSGWISNVAIALQVVNFLVSLGVITGLFAMIYKILPRIKLAWRDVLIGSVVTATLFTVGKYAIGLYIAKSDLTSTYGATASVVVLLIWVYYAAQIFLLGAEFTAIFARRHGSLREINEGSTS